MSEPLHPGTAHPCLRTDAVGNDSLHFKTLVDATSDAMFIKDPAGRYRLCNIAAARLLGRPAEDIIGQDDSALFSATTAASIREQDRLVMVGGKTVTRDETLTMPDGASRSFQTTKGPMVDSEGRVCGLFGIARDITEQQRQEQALRMSEERFRLAMQGANDGIWDWDLRTNEVYFSERWKHMLGYDDHELPNVYSEWESRLHPDDHARVMSGLTDYLQSRREIYDVEYRLRKKDGSYSWIHARGKAVWDAEGHPLRMAGSHTDITGRKREEALQVAEKQTLELVAQGRPLQEVLTVLCRAIETHTAPMLSSVMLVTEDGAHLSPAAGPSLSDEYRRLSNGIPIGPTVGSCGSAAYYQQPAIVSDIATDPRWKGYVDVALAHGLKACWSQPIVSSAGTLLGTFAAYFPEPRQPQERDLQLLAQAGRIAALAIEHARSVEAVQESEKRFRLMFMHEPECVKTVASDGTLLAMNPAGLRMIEADSLEDVVGYSVMPLIHHDDRSAFWEAHCAAVNGSSRTLEFRVIGLKGQLRWLDMQSVPLRDSGGMITAVLSVTRDITERKRLEQAAQDQHDRLSLAMDIAGVSTWDWNILTNELICSENCEQVRRLPPGFFEGTFEAHQRLVHQDDLPGLQADIQAALSGQKPFRTEHRIVLPGGEVQWVEGNGVVYRDELGRPIRMVGTLRNITERKCAEQTLRLSEERFALAARATSDGIWDWNIETGEQFWSDRHRELFGLESSNFVSTYASWLSLVHPEDADRVHQATRRHLETGDPYDLEMRVRMRDGSYRWFHDRGQAVRDANGKPVRMVGSISDITERRMAEEALLSSRQRFELAARTTIDGLWDWNIVTGELYWSDRNFELFGMEPGAVTPSYEVWLSVVHPEDVDRAHHAVEHHLATRAPYDLELRVKMQDGRYRWFRDQGQAVWDASGKPIRMVGSISDITDRRHADEALRASQERFELAGRATNDGIWDWNIVTNEIYWADRTHELLGLQPGEIRLSYEAWLSVVHPDDAERAHDAATRHLTLHEPYDLELRVRKKGTGYRWFRAQGQAVWDDAGQPIRMVGSISDITERRVAEEALRAAHADLEHRVKERTWQLEEANQFLQEEVFERKRAEAAIRESELRYKLLADATFDGVAIHDQGILIEVNSGLERMYGYEAGELIGRSILELAAEESRDLLIANMQAGVRGPYEAIGRRKDGSTFPGEVVVRPYRYRGKEVRLVAGRDITARKHLEAERARRLELLEQQVAERTAEITKLESQRAQAEKLAAMGRLAAGVAHEINNPLAGIKNAFTLVRQAVDPAHPSAEFAGLIDREIARVGAIIQNMYQLCRTESRQGETVDLWTLLKDLQGLLTPLLLQRRLTLVVDLGSAPQWLCVPRGDLMQVLLNLLSNAVDCSPEGGTITVGLQGGDEGILIAVNDQGPGIALEHLAQIFDPFFTTKTGTDQKGMGLGLSISQSLVQAMGGRIDVDTEVGRGSTFHVRLPRERVAVGV